MRRTDVVYDAISDGVRFVDDQIFDGAVAGEVEDLLIEAIEQPYEGKR